MTEETTTEAPKRPSWSYGEITATDELGDKATINLEFGNSLEYIIKEFGEEQVYYRACLQLRKAFRDKLYSLVKPTPGKDEDDPATPGMTADAALAEMDNFKPTLPVAGAGRSRKSASEKALNAYSKMDPEEQQKFLAALEESG